MLKSVICSLSLLFVTATACAADCPMADTRVCGIVEKIEAHGTAVPVRYHDLEAGTPAQATQSRWLGKAEDLLVLGNTKELSDGALMFVLAHEYAHSQLRHGRQLLEALVPEQARSMPDAELFAQYHKVATPRLIDRQRSLNHRQEYEADAFAAKVLRAAGHDPVVALREVITQEHDTPTHPGVDNRAERLERTAQK